MSKIITPEGHEVEAVVVLRGRKYITVVRKAYAVFVDGCWFPRNVKDEIRFDRRTLKSEDGSSLVLGEE